MRFLDLFAGIGGFRLGMEQAGHECVGFCEIDKFARKSYKAIHDTEGEVEWHDITTITDNNFRLFRGQVDVICGGFPCQAFSVAGKRRGFEDTRGTLFFDIARAAKQIQPRILFLENVKGLLSHDKGRTFATILTTLDELGYDAEWQVCNSKDFGVPQNRERVFIIGHFRGTSRRKVFPIEGTNGKTNIPIKQIAHRKGFHTNSRTYSPDGITGTLDTSGGGGRELHVAIQPVLTPDRLEKRQNGRRFKEEGEPMFTLTSQDRHGVLVSGKTGVRTTEQANTLDASYYKGLGNNQERTGVSVVGNVNPSGNGMNGQVYKSEGLSPTLTTNKGEGPKITVKEATKKGYDIAEPGDSVNYSLPNSKTRRGRVGKQIANTLDTGCQQGVVTEEIRIRKLTPKECFRLQGFPDWAFDKAQEVNSDSQLYKQAGNSVTVNVIYEIAKRL